MQGAFDRHRAKNQEQQAADQHPQHPSYYSPLQYGAVGMRTTTQDTCPQASRPHHALGSYSQHNNAISGLSPMAANISLHTAPSNINNSSSAPILPGLSVVECGVSTRSSARQYPPPPSTTTPPADESSSRRTRQPIQYLRSGATPASVLRVMGHVLTSYEKSEILAYEQVWFAGRAGINKVKGSYLSPHPNGGYDDGHGYYIPITGDHILYRYEILDMLGRGSFGQVLCCLDHATGQHVALKLIRNKTNFQRQAQVEASILKTLQQKDPHDAVNIVRMMDSFTFRNHLCITFELLSINLYERIKASNFRGATPTVIKQVAVQMLKALDFLKSLDIVHCDIKPENILLHNDKTAAIKLIDFGSSCYSNKPAFTYIQSRFYRAPEVILGLQYGTAIDIWSLGCVCAELHAGHPIFPGETESDQLAFMMDYLGYPPIELVRSSKRASVFFHKRNPFDPKAVPLNSNRITHRPNSRSLEQALGPHTDPKFIDFLRLCWAWDPAVRITPAEALCHEWLADHWQV